MGLFGRGRRGAREVWADWQEADRVEDFERAGRLAQEMVEVAGGEFAAWFEAGLYSKARGEWAESAARNARAVELFTDNDARVYDGVNPAAWNLGIAATAVGDWAAARRAWAAYGIEGIAEGAEPIDGNYGLTPVRLNPDRPSLTHQVPVGIGDTEVVWCWRRSPAHAVIASVPLPESGHRFRDVVLHDGEPKGYRRRGDQEVAVFDELARLDESGLQTWQAQVLGAGPDELSELEELVGSQGLGMEEWSGIRLMCSDCSHGTPEVAHDHPPASSDAAVVGLAGSEAELQACLESWLADRPRVTVAELTLLW